MENNDFQSNIETLSDDQFEQLWDGPSNTANADDLIGGQKPNEKKEDKTPTKKTPSKDQDEDIDLEDDEDEKPKSKKKASKSDEEYEEFLEVLLRLT